MWVKRKLKRIAVDLTPLLPGGDNGGAKPLAVMLIRQLALAAPDCEFVLLTQEKTHQELAALDAPNVRRLCTTQPENAPTVSRQKALAIRRLLLRIMPPALVERLGRLYIERFERAPAAETSLLRQIGAGLLSVPSRVCCFTTLTFPSSASYMTYSISTTRSSSTPPTATSATAISATSAE